TFSFLSGNGSLSKSNISQFPLSCIFNKGVFFKSNSILIVQSFLYICLNAFLIISYSSVVLYPFPPLPVNSKKVKLSVINTKALPDKQFFFFHFDMFTVQKTNCTSSM